MSKVGLCRFLLTVGPNDDRHAFAIVVIFLRWEPKRVCELCFNLYLINRLGNSQLWQHLGHPLQGKRKAGHPRDFEIGSSCLAMNKEQDKQSLTLDLPLNSFIYIYMWEYQKRLYIDAFFLFVYFSYPSNEQTATCAIIHYWPSLHSFSYVRMPKRP